MPLVAGRFSHGRYNDMDSAYGDARVLFGLPVMEPRGTDRDGTNCDGPYIAASEERRKQALENS